MTIDINDPRLTAYALGELDGADRAVVESAVAASPALRAEVDAIRRMGDTLATEFSAVPAEHLDAVRRAAIEAAAEAPVRTTGGRVFKLWLPSALAASLVLAAGIWYALPTVSHSRDFDYEAAASRSPGALVEAPSAATAVQNQDATDGVEEDATRQICHASRPSTSFVGLQASLADYASPQERIAALMASAGIEGTDELLAAEKLEALLALMDVEESGTTVQVRYQDAAPLRDAIQGYLKDLNGNGARRRTLPAPGDGGSGQSVFSGGSSGGREIEIGYADRRHLSSVASHDDLVARNDTGDLHADGYAAFRRVPDFAGSLYDSMTQGWTPQIDLQQTRSAPQIDIQQTRRGIEHLRFSLDGGAGRYVEPPSIEAYAPIFENPFTLVAGAPLSTFSIDVDSASYSNVRRFLNQYALPPPNAVRVEELINYFDYEYPQPADGHPFSVNVEVADCPWKENHLLARVGLAGKIIAPNKRPAANLVFLVDVSGSMDAPNRLPLVKDALKMLAEQLQRNDSVAMAVYAGASGLVLPPTPATQRGEIIDAIDRLDAGGPTNGGAGIQLAYDTAASNFIEGGINRVILCTDGDFNLGLTSPDGLVGLVEQKAKTGVFLTVLGFGMGNLKDWTLEELADKGNGHYAYIDSAAEARRVLVDQVGATLVTIAKDVKIQVEFNPAQISAYRLIGYENRMLAAHDFNDDKKDAGEIGAGHTVTALYELVPVGVPADVPSVDPLKYQRAANAPAGAGVETEGSQVPYNGTSADDGDAETADAAETPGTPGNLTPAALTGELMTVKLRYKDPDGDTSKLISVAVTDAGATLDDASDDFAFAASVAAFGMLLRGSKNVGEFTYADVTSLASTATGHDTAGLRAEFLGLVKAAESLTAARANPTDPNVEPRSGPVNGSDAAQGAQDARERMRNNTMRP